MNKITVSAPGKLLLLGEHAVVYNHPCLVTAVDQRMRATVELINEPFFELQAPDVQIADYKKPMSEVGKGDIPKGAKFVEVAVANLLGRSRNKSKIPRGAFGMTGKKGIKVTTKSEFSSQFGFGSSSASTVCTVKAVSELLDLNLSQKEIFDLAYKTVLDIQGKGSGFDVAAGIFGGTLYFVTGGKVIQSLNIKSLSLVVGYSGIKADTVTLINKVKESFANRQNRLSEIYNGIEILVNEAKGALLKKDWKKFGEIMNKNQEYLKELGVSIGKLDLMIKGALNVGAYGAKLTGAGRGDCMIALYSAASKLNIKKAVEKAGGKIIDIKTNAEGVRIE
ncbi:MAG: mevalonate kinase [Candidatus Levybacteria bacterium]|nr:mevalonate kinase [Candidatus Levybacteria bacterium]